MMRRRDVMLGAATASRSQDPRRIWKLGATATRAATQATGTLPIVFYGNFDPVATGTVTNLARPGGNVTGILIAPEGIVLPLSLLLRADEVIQ